MSSALFYEWRGRYGQMDASTTTRLKKFKEENRRLKKMYAEERRKAEIPARGDTKKKQYSHLDARR
jgi:putative transposase